MPRTPEPSPEPMVVEDEGDPAEAEPTKKPTRKPTEEPEASEATEEADAAEPDEIQRLGASGKARAYLIALRDSEPRASYTPTDRTIVVNGVEIFVPKGAIAAKPAGELPQPLAMGCDLVLEAFDLEPDAPAPDEAPPQGHVRLAAAP